MRGKGRARIVLFATLGTLALAAFGCARAGDSVGDAPDVGAATTMHESGASSITQGGREASAEETGDDDGAIGDADEDASALGDATTIFMTDAGGMLGDEVTEVVYEDGGYEYPEASASGADAAQDATVPADATTQGVEASVADTGGDVDEGDGSTGPDGGATLDAGADVVTVGPPPGDAAAEAAACGGCASGFSCGPSGYCVSPTGVPAFGHVYVVVMEEQSLATIQGNTSAPYINSLISGSSLAINYTAPDHPSLPNYLELTSGGSQSVVCDCAPAGTLLCSAIGAVCTDLLASNCDCPQNVTHLGDELDTAGVPWREYAEDMGSPCNVGGTEAGADFAASHVPFLYYDDMYTTSGRCAEHVRDYGDFAGDLVAGSVRFSMISPNTCNDMQLPCALLNPVKQGDDWLSTNVPPILATPGFAAGGHDVLFILWEEAGPAIDSPTPPLVPLLVVSPLALSTTTDTAYTHYSLLATIEDGLGVARLGSAVGIAPIADVWK